MAEPVAGPFSANGTSDPTNWNKYKVAEQMNQKLLDAGHGVIDHGVWQGVSGIDRSAEIAGRNKMIAAANNPQMQAAAANRFKGLVAGNQVATPMDERRAMVIARAQGHPLNATQAHQLAGLTGGPVTGQQLAGLNAAFPGQGFAEMGVAQQQGLSEQTKMDSMLGLRTQQDNTRRITEIDRSLMQMAPGDPRYQELTEERKRLATINNPGFAPQADPTAPAVIYDTSGNKVVHKVLEANMTARPDIGENIYNDPGGNTYKKMFDPTRGWYYEELGKANQAKKGPATIGTAPKTGQQPAPNYSNEIGAGLGVY